MNHLAFVTGPADFLNLYSYLQHYGIDGDSISIVLFGNSRNISDELRIATEKMAERPVGGSFHYLDSSRGAEGVSALKKMIGPANAAPTNLFMTHVFGDFASIASSSLLFGKYFFDVEPHLMFTEFENESRYPHLTNLKSLLDPG